MQPKTRTLTRMETVLAADVPKEDRRQTMTELRNDHRPDLDTIAALVPVLIDVDDELREMAELLLLKWGPQAVTVLLSALRSSELLDVPLRLAIIQLLARMGPTAARAETLLQNLKDDPNVGEAAQDAIRIIRGDVQDLVNRFAEWGVELLLLGVCVGAPMAAARILNPQVAWPPLGIVIGFGAVAMVGLMLARVVYAGDLLPDRESDDVVRTKRWMLYGYLAMAGVAVGAALSGLMVACGGAAQKLMQ